MQKRKAGQPHKGWKAAARKKLRRPSLHKSIMREAAACGRMNLKETAPMIDCEHEKMKVGPQARSVHCEDCDRIWFLPVGRPEVPLWKKLQSAAFEAWVAEINVLAAKAGAIEPGQYYTDTETWEGQYHEGMTPEEAWDEECSYATE